MTKYAFLLALTICSFACRRNNTQVSRISECFGRNSDALEEHEKKVVLFPMSNSLKLYVPQSWMELSLEDEEVHTLYLADSSLYAKSKKIFSIALTSSKKEIEVPEISIELANKVLDKSLSRTSSGETICYGKKCIWQLAKEGSMSYLSFSFIHNSRLRIINASTDSSQDSLNYYLCQVINILSTDAL